MTRTRLIISFSAVLFFSVLIGCGTTQAVLAAQQGAPGAPGLIFLNAYKPDVTYVPPDVVTYQGSSYVAISTSIGVAPMGASGSAADWAVLAQAGATGAAGVQGPVGAQGAQGPVGMTGAMGSAGPAGPLGPTGVQGVQGVQGPAGPIGLTLQSTYSTSQQYVPRDVVFYQGSSYVALASSLGVMPSGSPISGADWAVIAQAGADGPQGPVGAQGPIGDTGPIGLQGVQGPQGIMGPQGLVGMTGPSGPSGPQGAVGAQGVSGPQGPTGPTGATGPIGPAGPSGSTYLQGRRMAVQGDSISELFSNAWQSVVASRTGITFAVQEAHPGRRFDTAFECWSNPPVGGSLGPFTASHTLSGVGGTCAGNSIGITDGSTFADSLANIDLELIELSTNDTSVPLGQLGDATNAGTFYGNMRWVVETYLTAKPSIRLVLITLQYNGLASAVTAQQYANAMVTYGKSMGVPVINMYELGGVNAITAPVLLRDDIHPSDFGFANFYGPVIAQGVMQIF
jgi:hypothetical protein